MRKATPTNAGRRKRRCSWHSCAAAPKLKYIRIALGVILRETIILDQALVGRFKGVLMAFGSLGSNFDRGSRGGLSCCWS